MRHAVKILGGALIGTLAAPTAALTAHAIKGEPIILGDWLPAPEHHGEPRHTVGGTPQQALLSTGTSPTSISSVWTIDSATPMAEVLQLNDSLKAVGHHHRILLDTAVRVVEWQLVRNNRSA